MGVEGSGAGAQLARRAGIVGAAVAASRVLGLVREQLFAVCFGAGRELDAFITAFRIPNLLRDLFAEGALSAAFVASFTQVRERDGAAAAWRLANLVVNALLVVVGAICLGGMCFAPAVARTIAPGFADIPGKLELTAALARLMAPFLLLVALAAVAMGILNTSGVFGIPAAAAAFFNVGSIVGGVAAGYWLAPSYFQSIVDVLRGGAHATPDPALAARAITGMAVGTLLGGFLQLAVQLPSVARVGYRYRPMLDPSNRGFRQVMRLMGPATIGAAAVQVNVFVNNNFASYLGNGPVSWLNVAFRLMQLPIGLFGVSVGTVALPALSQHVARADTDALRATLRQALALVATLCLPAAAGLAVFGTPIVGVIYEHGRFTAADTTAAAEALAAYAAGLAGYAGIKVLAPAFFAFGDARTPMMVSLLSIATNYALNWTLVRGLGFGHVGLALSTSAVAFGNCCLLYVALRRRIGPLGGGLTGSVGRTLLATTIMIAVASAVDAVVAPILPPRPVVHHAARLAAVLPSALAAYWGACRLLGVSMPRLRQRRA